MNLEELKKQCKTLPIRDVFNVVKHVPIQGGGLYVILEKIVYEIEKLQEKRVKKDGNK